MADNGTAASGPTIAWDDIAGVAYQRQKVTFGADGSSTDVSSTNPLPVVQPTSTTGTITSPSLSASSFTILASNTSRRGATVYNDSNNVVYLALASTASTTSYTVQIPAGGFYELSYAGMIYTGIITGIALVATGNCRVTELT